MGLTRLLRIHQIEGIHMDYTPMTAGERALTVFQTYGENVRKLFWPHPLTPLYPKVIPEHILSLGVLFGVAAVVGSLVALWLVRRDRAMSFGLVWFFVAMAPSSQVIAHQIHRADRYFYVPIVGLALVVAGGLIRATARPRAVRPVLAVASVLVLAMAVRSRVQMPVWRNGETLFTHVVACSPNDHKGHNLLGGVWLRRGRNDRAYASFVKAAELDPAAPDVRFNLGVTERRRGNLDAAIAHFEDALRLSPQMYDAYNEIGEIYVEQGRLVEAREQFAESLRFQPGYETGRANMKAVTELLESAGAARAAGAAALKRADYVGAAAHYREALRLYPMWAAAANDLAWVLGTAPEASVRDGKEAVRLAELAVQEIGEERKAAVLDTLAAAYAEAGRFEQAVTTAREAIRLAEAAGDASTCDALRARMKLYQARQAYRDSG
jgi:tetratricopeptide (TPR) repeat protein